MAFSSVAAAADVPEAPAGLVDQVSGAGEAPLDLVDRPGFKLSQSLRLRLEYADRLYAVAHGDAVTGATLVDKKRARRFGSLIDFYPISDNGFHLTAGYRKMPRPQRRGVGGGSSSGATAFDIGGPTIVALAAHNNIARRSPMMTAGWTGMIAKEMQLGFAAGAIQQHGRSAIEPASMVADNTPKRWSRVGGIASVNLAMRF